MRLQFLSPSAIISDAEYQNSLIDIQLIERQAEVKKGTRKGNNNGYRNKAVALREIKKKSKKDGTSFWRGEY